MKEGYKKVQRGGGLRRLNNIDVSNIFKKNAGKMQGKLDRAGKARIGNQKAY